MSALLLPPRRRLPWDVLVLVVENSDTDTLALLGRVSLDFLAASNLRLYRHIEIRSVEQLAALFCERTISQEASTNTSQINSLLDLSRIRTLSLDFANSPSSSEPPPPDHRTLSLHRIPLNTPFPLHTVRLSLGFAPTSILSFLHQFLHQFLLPHLNPLHLIYNFQDPDEKSRIWLRIPKVCPPLSGWSRIQSLESEGYLVYTYEDCLLAGLQRPSKDVRRVLRLRVASFLRAWVSFPDFLEALQDPISLGLPGMQDGSIFLVVSSEEEKVRVKLAISLVLERWRPLFVVELED